jgi:hypothetical protein
VATASVPNTFASAVTATGLQLDTNYNTIVAYLNEPLNRNNYAADSGNTNTIVLTFSPAVSAYSAGLEITFKAANTNSGAAVINANSLGNKSFVQPGGSALAAGQIEAAGIYKAAYDGTNFVYIGQNVLAASQAQMETATSAVTFVSPNAMKWHPGVAKAWAYWHGTETGTITALASLNVANVVRNGEGDYTVNFSTAFSSTAYGGIVFCGQSGGGSDIVAWGSTVAQTVSAFPFRTGSSSVGNFTDAGFITAMFLGDQ